MKDKLILLFLILCPVFSWAQSVDGPIMEESPSVAVRLDSLKKRCDSLQRALDNLLPLRESKAGELLEMYNDYFDGPFSSIDYKVADSLADLSSILDVRILDEFNAKIDNAVSRKRAYESLYAVVDTTYNQSVVDSARVRVDSLLKVSSASQTKEVNALKEAMRVYPAAVGETKALAEWIHDTMELYRPSGNPKAAVSMLNSILTNQKDTRSKYIDKVPYLKRVFQQMVDDLKANHLAQGEAETRLLKL